MNPIIRGFARLLDFKGRDRRGQFWPYAGVVCGASIIASAAVALPTVFNQFSQTLAFAEANPDKATVYRSATSVKVVIHDPQGMPPTDIGMATGPVSIVMIVAALLLAAAVTRRLHDKGISGFWALIPAGLYALGLTMWVRLMSTMLSATGTADGGAFMIQFMLSFAALLIAQLAMVVLMIVLAIKGKTGPNRYGLEPV